MVALTDAQRWVLALPAVLNEVNGAEHVYMGGVPRPFGSAEGASLLRDNEVQTPEQATETLERLFAKDRTDMLGWDLGRVVTIAGWCYAAYLLDAQTVWGWMTKAAAKLQTSLSSWTEYGESYLRGRDDWRGGRPPNANDEEQRAVVKRLLSSAESPWVLLPWQTPLDGAVPVAPQRTLLVDAKAKKGFTTIASALADASDGDRISVRAGVYAETLDFEKSVEIVAEGKGEVLIEGEKGAVITVDDVGVVITGVTLHTKKARGKKEGANAVHASGGFLRMERCTVTAAHFGIYLLDGDAEVHLDGSRVVSCGNVGVFVEGEGTFVARDTMFEKNGSANLQIGGESHAYLFKARITASPGSGMQLHGKADISLRDCDVTDNPEGGVVATEDAKLKLDDCRFTDNGAAHIWLGASGTSSVSSCDIEGGNGVGIQVKGDARITISNVNVQKTARVCVGVSSGSPTIEGSTLAGSEASGVFVEGKARPKISYCSIENNDSTGVEVRDGADPEFRDCTIGDNTGDAVHIHESGRGRFSRCVLAGSTDAGVRVLTKGAPIFNRCRIEGNAKEGAVVAQGGKAIFVKCDVQKNDLGFYVAERGVLTVRGGRVHDNKSDGIYASEASLTLEDCELDANEVNVRLEGRDAHLARCRVHDARSAGVFVGGKAHIEDCDIYANADGGLGVGEASDPVVVRCHVHDNQGDDVSVYDKARGTFEDGAIGGGTGWALLVSGASRPKLRRVKIRSGTKGDVSHDAKSKPTLDECELGAGKDFTIAALAPKAALPGELGKKLERIDALLARVNTDAADALNEGAADAMLAKLSKAVFDGKPVPDDVVTFFRWHDGQSSVASLHRGDNRTPMSVEQAIDAWMFLCDPTEDVLQPWSSSWLPLFENGAGDHLCVVTAGKGAGSLVEYWHSDTDRKTTYASLIAWADEVIASLEK